jgi:hypothetical protein
LATNSSQKSLFAWQSCRIVSPFKFRASGKFVDCGLLKIFLPLEGQDEVQAASFVYLRVSGIESDHDLFRFPAPIVIATREGQLPPCVPLTKVFSITFITDDTRFQGMGNTRI